MNINRITEVKLGPLDVLGKRELRYLPVHFQTADFDERNRQKIVHWIRTKLTGRYAICKVPKINSGGNLKTTTVIGFEDEKELTYFMLACPYTRRT